MNVEDKLTFLKPLQDIEVVEAEQAILIVETNILPRIVKWYKNGQEVKPISGRIEIKNNTTKFQLIINKAEIDDAADYKVLLCLAQIYLNNTLLYQYIPPISFNIN